MCFCERVVLAITLLHKTSLGGFADEKRSGVNRRKLEFFKFLFTGCRIFVYGGFSDICWSVFQLPNWGGGKRINFIGVENYISLVQDQEFWNAFLNNLQIIAICLIGQMLLGLLIAIL